jgi:hypothetical protein
MKLFALVMATGISLATAACPNTCSGHGTCSALDQCTCYLESAEAGSEAMWTGADCSEMTCPRGTSWINADGSLTHETNVECSDGGTCDRSTGECSCFDGYEGSACQRTSCPNDCSGHGICRSNTDFATDFSEAITLEQTDVTGGSLGEYYDYFRVTYSSAWDAGLHYGCKCDIGFRGPDCSLIECPTSEDPMDAETCTKYANWYDNASPDGGNTIHLDQFHASNNAYYNPISEYPCNGAPAGVDCSGRGRCNYNIGVCDCHPGFSGTACEDVQQLG